MTSVLSISTFKEDVLMLSRAICVAAFAVTVNAIADSETSLAPTAILEALDSPTLLCILGSRMFFNLKEAAEHNVNVGTNWSSYSHSAIRFDEPGSRDVQYVILRVIFVRNLINVGVETKTKLSTLLA